MKNTITAPATATATTTTFEVSWTPKTQSRMPGHTGKKTGKRIARFRDLNAASAASDFLNDMGFQNVEIRELNWHKLQSHFQNFATFAKCFGN